MTTQIGFQEPSHCHLWNDITAATVNRGWLVLSLIWFDQPNLVIGPALTDCSGRMGMSLSRWQGFVGDKKDCSQIWKTKASAEKLDIYRKSSAHIGKIRPRSGRLDLYLKESSNNGKTEPKLERPSPAGKGRGEIVNVGHVSNWSRSIYKYTAVGL